MVLIDHNHEAANTAEEIGVNRHAVRVRRCFPYFFGGGGCATLAVNRGTARSSNQAQI